MVIQNNIPGLNSKRLYSKNSSKLAKSLEKLSSGYSINRAGDNAAGLAVSEKMRSQIFGMQQAVKNCQDGISLIQTFEGALGETVAIIKRMKSLADQSANGTYDDSVDRNAVEIEYLHLCDEVNQIAETDFNGIVMLNGKDSGVKAAALERAVNSAIDGSLDNVSTVSSHLDVLPTAFAADTAAVQAAVFAAPKAGGVACGDFTVYGSSSDFSFDTANGVLTILGGDVTVEGTGAATQNTIVVAKDKSANVTLRNVNIDVSGTVNACAFKIEDDSKGDVTVTLEGNNFLKSGVYCAGLQKNGGVATGTLTIQGNGSLVAIAGAAGAGIGGNFCEEGSNIIIVSGTITATSYGDNPNGYYVVGGGAGIGGGDSGSGNNIKILGGIVNASSVGGAGIGGGHSGGGNNILISNGVITAITYDEDWGESGSGIGSGYDGSGSSIMITGGEVIAKSIGHGAGIGGGYDSAITISGGKVIAVNEGGYGAGIGGSGFLFDRSINIVIKNEETVVIAKGGKYAEDIGRGGDGSKATVTVDNILTKEPYSGNGIVDGTIVHYTGGNSNPFDPTDPDNPNPINPITPDNPNIPDNLEKLIVSIPNAFGNATAKLTYTDSLILQAGARTKDSVNFTFSYSAGGIGGLTADLNCTAKGLGLDVLSLSAQESANFAIDRLDHALNKVSMIRATFGAAQNRLEHKIDNLNNTTENLTAAESQIRDTDMAQEMMNFTKQQILTQASQSMLAQATSLPQQVLGLISS